MKRSALNMVLVIIATIIFSIIIAGLFIVGHDINTSPIAKTTAIEMVVGVFLGSIFCSLVIAYGLAILINAIFNMFRKEKKPFSYLWVWLFLIVSFFIIAHINTMYNAHYRIMVREQFATTCTASAEKKLNLDTASADQRQAIIDQAVSFCNDAKNVFFDTFDNCMDTMHNAKTCKWQADYQTCMKSKHDDSACKDYANSNPQ